MYGLFHGVISLDRLDVANVGIGSNLEFYLKEKLLPIRQYSPALFFSKRASIP